MSINAGDYQEVLQLAVHDRVGFIARLQPVQQDLVFDLRGRHPRKLFHQLGDMPFVGGISFGDRPHLGRSGKLHVPVVIERNQAEATESPPGSTIDFCPVQGSVQPGGSIEGEEMIPRPRGTECIPRRPPALDPRFQRT
jgi:hypothetical protein